MSAASAAGVGFEAGRLRSAEAVCFAAAVLLHVAVMAFLPGSETTSPPAPPVTVTLLAPPEPKPAAPAARVPELLPGKPAQALPQASKAPLPPSRIERAPVPPPALLQRSRGASEPRAEPDAASASSPDAPLPTQQAGPERAERETSASEPRPGAVEPSPIVPPRFDAAYLHNPKPEYPRLARRLGEQGTVLIDVYVGADGLPRKIELKTSSGSPRLDQAARETVERWKFVPARQGERPVEAWITVPIRFALEG